MRILFAALKYDYGRPDQGYSFEYYNFYDSLVRMGNDILYFDLGSVVSRRGKEAANQLLLEAVRVERPDALFAVLFRDELDERVVREISENTNTTTIAWFSDDHWRFESYSRAWAPNFNWAVTTSTAAVAKYHALGYHNVIKSQWACNTALYAPMELPKRLPVSFVGLPHGDRRYVTQVLRDSGIEVHTFGKGWDAGRVTQSQMIRIFNESCINLNLANKSTPGSTMDLALMMLRNGLARSSVPRRVRIAGTRKLMALERRLLGPRSAANTEQIKGRNFEVPGCGGFLLTADVENLKEYYHRGSEVACYRDTADLVVQVRNFLADPDLRESIASSGRDRTLREHTYAHRFATIFDRVGLASVSADSVNGAQVQPGRTDEVC